MSETSHAGDTRFTNDEKAVEQEKDVQEIGSEDLEKIAGGALNFNHNQNF